MLHDPNIPTTQRPDSDESIHGVEPQGDERSPRTQTHAHHHHGKLHTLGRQK